MGQWAANSEIDVKYVDTEPFDVYVTVSNRPDINAFELGSMRADWYHHSIDCDPVPRKRGPWMHRFERNFFCPPGHPESRRGSDFTGP